jgi:hypothetical protein
MSQATSSPFGAPRLGRGARPFVVCIHTNTRTSENLRYGKFAGPACTSRPKHYAAAVLENGLGNPPPFPYP